MLDGIEDNKIGTVMQIEKSTGLSSIVNMRRKLQSLHAQSCVYTALNHP